MQILITGANGQLGQCLNKLAGSFPEHQFIFVSSSELDITQPDKVLNAFEKYQPDYCINAAAYTNVEGAEQHKEDAFLVNEQGAKNIASACAQYNTTLLHISTDYVFDGDKPSPYLTSDPTGPINVYGASKLAGEEAIKALLTRYFIIRTSWLYSEFGKNFYKTILDKAKSVTELNVTDEQLGCPTNANDLAAFCLKIIKKEYQEYGILHFCGGVPMTWYDFALSILKEHHLSDKVMVYAKSYQTLAKRPKNSVLQNSVID